MTRPYVRLSILWHLMEEGTATAAELAKLIGGDKASIGASLKKLEGTLVTRTVDPANRRRVICALTPAGIEAALRVQRDEVEFA